MIQHNTIPVVVCKTPAQGKLRASKMRGSIIRKFNPQQLTYAVTQAPVNVSKPKVWSPDTDLQDLQSHCEVKELAGVEGEKAWNDSLCVQDFVASFEDTIPGPL
jgi:hypothetical protein